MLRLCLLLTLPAAAPAATLTGTVTDSATGIALPYVSVALPQLERGAYTDLHGRYALAGLPAGSWQVRASCIGYRAFAGTLALAPGAAARLDVSLAPAPIPLGPDADLPERSLQDLLQGAAGRAHEHVFHARYEALKTHRFSIRGTQTLYGGTDRNAPILARIDYDGEGYYRNPGQIAQAVTAYRAHRAPGQGFGMHPGVIVNIRKGHLNGRDFDVGPLPLQPEAQAHYRYRLVDSVQMGGLAVYRIRVAPRKKKRPGLEGDVWVSGADFSLVGYDLKLNRAACKKIRVRELRTYQESALYYDRYWLPVKQTVRIRTDALAEQVAHLSGYTFNLPLPDSLFASPLAMRPGAGARDAAYWAVRDSSLLSAERNAVRRLLENSTLPEGWKRLLDAPPLPPPGN